MFRSSVNQKTESEAASEARRNRSQKDQKSFFFYRFRFRFRRFRSSENKVIGIGSGSGIISQSKNYVEVCVIFYLCIWDVEQVCKTFPITMKTKIQNWQHIESRTLCLTYDVLSQAFQIRLDFSFLKILHVPAAFSFSGSVANLFFVI